MKKVVFIQIIEMLTQMSKAIMFYDQPHTSWVEIKHLWISVG